MSEVQLMPRRMLRTVFGVLALCGFTTVRAEDEATFPGTSTPPKIRRLVFSEQHIEGKIRRPQVVLIKAEQRPSFPPMAIQSLGGSTAIVDFVPREVIDYSPYAAAFQFEGTRVSNCTP